MTDEHKDICPHCSEDISDVTHSLKKALGQEREGVREWKAKAKETDEKLTKATIDLAQKGDPEKIAEMQAEIDTLTAKQTATAKEIDTLTAENSGLKTEAETGKISEALTKAQANVTVMTPHIREKLRADPNADIDEIVATLKTDPVFAGSFKASEQSGSGSDPSHSGDGPSTHHQQKGAARFPSRRGEFSDLEKVAYINANGVDQFMSIPE